MEQGQQHHDHPAAAKTGTMPTPPPGALGAGEWQHAKRQGRHADDEPAAEIAEAEEKVRVWDFKAHDGAPFVTFNPVMGKPLPLEAGNTAVSHRKYRIIAADRAIDATEAA
jgi:hypothetical protein